MTFQPEFTGRSQLLVNTEAGAHQLLVAVTCEIGGEAGYFDALLDTASEWCVLGAEAQSVLGSDFTGEPARLSTRFGVCDGVLARMELTFPALDGTDLQMEATWFVSEEWPGPTVIGWRGALERLRFAVDPADELFYFDTL